MLNKSKDAITASGKKFDEISKDTFLSFFQKENMPRDSWEPLYAELCAFYGVKKSGGKKDTDDTKQAQVDYYSSSHNDVKQRTPRKSIFGKISKIAG